MAREAGDLCNNRDNMKSVLMSLCHSGCRSEASPVISDGADIVEDKAALKGVPIEAHTNYNRTDLWKFYKST